MANKRLAAVTHLAFADEKDYNRGRYRGIALVSLKNEDFGSFNKELIDLLDESDMREFEWKKLYGARERFAALKMIDFAIKKAITGSIRIDTLTWDTRDSRHKVKGRDDIANLQRMYHHLFKNVLCDKWPDGRIWQLFPDENTALDWNRIQDFLDFKSTKTEVRRDLFSKGKFNLRLKREFRIECITSCESNKTPFVQLADLFVGLSIYSRSCFDRYTNWKVRNTNQCALFTDDQATLLKLSKSDQERCLVLDEFDKKCKKHRLGVSLKTARGLKTFDHSKPINFWWYEPQYELDKAPCRVRK